MSERASLLKRLGLVAAWLLLLALVAWAYQPGLAGPLILDDQANLEPLNRLDVSRDFALDVAAANPSGVYGRPLAMLSFTLERLYLDRGTRGQKTIGLLLHLCNATLVLLLALLLFRAAGVSHAGALAFGVAALWLSMPLLVSTTLYVVQRITQLSALFVFSALVCYCLGRNAQLAGRNASPWWFALSVLAILLAALSKENGLLAIPLISLLEIFVYRFRSGPQQQGSRLRVLHAVAIGLPLFAAASLMLVNPGFILDGYALREFSFSERLLTETRILFDYIRQILWVDVHRLGVYHDDIELSRSLLSPPQTLAAVLAWLAAAAGVVYAAISGRLRLPALGLGFFMVGHAMESTVFSLELYFEHRNYLPAFGILFALVAAARTLAERWPPLGGWLVLVLVCLVGRNIFLLSSQAVIWSDDRLLHMEAANYHPDSRRANLEMARVYAQGGNIEAALELAEKAYEDGDRSPAEERLLKAVYHCIAGQPFPEGQFSDVVPGREELRSIPVNDFAHNITRLVIKDRCVEGDSVKFADGMWQWMFGGDEVIGTDRLFGSLMLVENHLQRYERALEYATLLTVRDPDSVMGWQFTLYLGHVLEQPERIEAATARLLSMKEAGQLTRQESSNLELFLDAQQPQGEVE